VVIFETFIDIGLKYTNIYIFRSIMGNVHHCTVSVVENYVSHIHNNETSHHTTSHIIHIMLHFCLAWWLCIKMLTTVLDVLWY
jgi:hypothetical protein